MYISDSYINFYRINNSSYRFKIDNQQVLLYSTGNSAQCCVAAWIGGELGGEWIHVHNTVNWLYFNIKLKVKIVTVVNY